MTLELTVSIDYHWMSYIHCKTNKLYYLQQVRTYFYNNDGYRFNGMMIMITFIIMFFNSVINNVLLS